MRSTLILKSDRTDFERFYIQNMHKNNVVTMPIYKFNHGLGWYIQVLWIEKLNLPFGNFFYGKWKKNISKYDTVIVFDRNLNWNIFTWIKKKNPVSRCIAWYWNPIQNAVEKCIPENVKELCEVWSFDHIDCDRFNYKKNVQFYFHQVGDRKKATMYDAFFVGVDKGRYAQVNEIINCLKQCNLKTFQGIVADKNSVNHREYIDALPYEKILYLIQNSKCIIDVPQENQEGMTLRVLESLFWSKKLITTYEGIEEFAFYNSNNILIWGRATLSEIKTFFEKPYEPVDWNIINRYSFENWLKNFGI